MITLAIEFGAGLQQQGFQLFWIGLSAARNLFAPDALLGAVDHGQAQFASAVLWGPGHAVKGLESTACDQKSFVDTERGVHGVFSLSAQSEDVPSVGLTVRLVPVLMHDDGVRVTC